MAMARRTPHGAKKKNKKKLKIFRPGHTVHVADDERADWVPSPWSTNTKHPAVHPHCGTVHGPGDSGNVYRYGVLGTRLSGSVGCRRALCGRMGDVAALRPILLHLEMFRAFTSQNKTVTR